MGSITSIKCVLTQEHLDAICAKYFVPEEVHPQLPSSDATMHERPTGKVGMYTRFFDYANYRIPFSTFFVSVLTHFRIPFSQLSVFGSAKVSHFEILLSQRCNINPSVGLFRYFYTHNYKNGWFGFTKRPNVRACYSKNLDSVKNWNDHFFWVDEFVVPANARFGWFSGTNIVKDRAPTISEYNVEHANTLIAQASPFLRFPKEFLCWVGISRNYLLNKDTYPRFEYENGEEMDLNAFIRTADPRKVRIVERERAENERPIVTVAKHRIMTLLLTSVVCPSGELSASIEREFVGDASGSGGGDQEIASVGGHDNVEPIVPTTDNVVAETEAPGPKRSKKKRVTRGSESTPAASHPPKRLRADYVTPPKSGTTQRNDLYNNVCDAITRGDTNAEGLRKRIVLAETFTGGPRYMMSNYQDAMALCRTYGNPDLFITFTSNPKWPEIFEIHLRNRVQKKGPPHVHILLWLEEHYKCSTPAQINDIISAEILSQVEDPEGYKLLTEFMLHDLLGILSYYCHYYFTTAG
ncbi:gypsy type transposase [Tanacetum coccineum]